MFAEIGRKNSFNLDFLFGSHRAPKMGTTNVGLISCQEIRTKKLIAKLTVRALYQNAKIPDQKLQLIKWLSIAA